MLAVGAGQVAKPVSHDTIATWQHHRHQLPHSRGAAWQPHGNHMVQSGYTSTGTRAGQKSKRVRVCVCYQVIQNKTGSHCVALISVSFPVKDPRFKHKRNPRLSADNQVACY